MRQGRSAQGAKWQEINHKKWDKNYVHKMQHVGFEDVKIKRRTSLHKGRDIRRLRVAQKRSRWNRPADNRDERRSKKESIEGVKAAQRKEIERAKTLQQLQSKTVDQTAEKKEGLRENERE